MTEPKQFLGHPSGLSTLFFTEMWERFSYYGMRALLLLFMVSSVDKGGFGLDDKTGAAVYGLYTMGVYLMALPGGWLADKFFGLRRAIFYGGCFIAVGHLLLIFPHIETFFLGLSFIVIGTGLLKPTVSSMVGYLYTSDEQIKRDAGFSLFYMGINLGGFISPIITGWLRINYGWHYGFIAAAVGMIIGLIYYKTTEHRLGGLGVEAESTGDFYLDNNRRKTITRALWGVSSLFVTIVTLMVNDVIVVNPIAIAQGSAIALAISFVIYFVYVFTFEKLDVVEKKRIAVIALLFLFSCVFWAGYEQQGSSLNLFAERYTNLTMFGYAFPAEWFQSVPPIFVVIFSIVFAWLWVKLEGWKLNPATPIKFSLGLLFMGGGFAVMIGASYVVIASEKASPMWLVVTYLLHTFGEICLYPVGLSAVTKLSPNRLVGQMMGIWFMSLAFGNLIAGLFAGEFDAKIITADPHRLVDLFLKVVLVMGVAGLIVLVLQRPIRKLMGPIR